MVSSSPTKAIQSLILSHLYRICHTLTKAKSHLTRAANNIHVISIIKLSMKKYKNKHKLFVGSFGMMHYNWCSSHVMPVSTHVVKGFSSDGWNYFDSSLNTSSLSTDSSDGNCMEDEDARLWGYLHWLEKKGDGLDEEDLGIEIDRLADMFIAENHEKFRLEKEESYRRYQDMMARSI